MARRVDDANVQRQRAEAGAVVVNVKTGAIEAMNGNPPYDPTLLASPNIATEKYA